MAYLLDANVFIRAKRDHYRFATFPCFWDWIVSQHVAGTAFSVKAVETEILAGGDDLATWITGISGAFLAADAGTLASASTVSAWVQDPVRAFTPSAVSDFFASADYWLVAHASAHGFTVVTHERPEPMRRNKVKIPDVCNGLGVSWKSTFDMLEAESARF